MESDKRLWCVRSVATGRVLLTTPDKEEAYRVSNEIRTQDTYVERAPLRLV